jgi:hypothetical protein
MSDNDVTTEVTLYFNHVLSVEIDHNSEASTAEIIDLAKAKASCQFIDINEMDLDDYDIMRGDS